MSRLSKDAWAKPTLKTKEVEVDELGGSVLIRELPAEYSADIASHIKLVSEGREQVAKVDTTTMERLQFAYGVVGDDGEPIFTEDEVRVLAKKHGRAFKTVIAAIDDLSGVDKEALKDAKARFPASAEGEGHGGKARSNATPARDSRPAVPSGTGA